MATLYPIPSGEAMSGTPYFAHDEATVDGTEQVVLDITVPNDITRQLQQARLTCQWDGSFKVVLNGGVIASGRTGPADRNVPVFWTPARTLSPGDQLQLLFKGAQGVPIGVKVEAQVMASDF